MKKILHTFFLVLLFAMPAFAQTISPVGTYDNCSQAITLTVGTTCVTGDAYTTVGATQSTGQPSTNLGIDDDVWFKFRTLPGQTAALIEIKEAAGGSGNAMEIWSACDGTAPLASVNVSNRIDAQGLTPETDYLVRVYTSGSFARLSTFKMCVSVSIPRAANDDCDNAVMLTPGTGANCTGIVNGTTVGATTNSFGIAGCSFESASTIRDVWYKFIATNSIVSVSLSDIVSETGTVTSMSMQLSADCNTASLACSTSGVLSYASLTAGNTYYIRVYNNDATSTTRFKICAKAGSPPANDEREGSLALTINPGAATPAFVSATNLASTPSSTLISCVTSTGNDVWFTFTPTAADLADGNKLGIRVFDASEFSTTFKFALYTEDATLHTLMQDSWCPDATSAFPDQNPDLPNLVAGRQYWLRLYNGGSVSYKIALRTFARTADECTDAIALATSPAGDQYRAGSTKYGTADRNYADCGGSVFSTKDIWYKFTAAETGLHTVKLRNISPIPGLAFGDNGSVGIQLYSGTCAGFTQISCMNFVGNTGTNTFDIAATAGSTYHIRITEMANSARPVTFEIAVQGQNARTAQTITFGAITPKTTDDADFTPAASASSGLAVTFTSSNEAVATIVAGKIHIVGVGTSTITAKQAGNITFSPAPDVTQTLTVNAGLLSQTITFNELPVKTYLDGNFNPGATASSGLTVTYASSDPAIAEISGGMIRILMPGMVTVTATQTGNTTYRAATPVTRTLTINKASQTITFNALAAITIGDADLDPAATASSGLTVEYTSSPVTVASIVSGKIRALTAGTATITASQPGNAYYNAAIAVSRSVTVNKKNQTINSTTLPVKTYLDADFNAGVTATSGLPVSYSSSNTGVATVAGNMIHIVGAGTTTITVSQAGDAEYNAAASIMLTFTVNKRTPAITFALTPKRVNEADFDPGATSTGPAPITYSSGNAAVATIVAGKIHLTGTGTSNITASQAETANYLAASANATLTVNPVQDPQTITIAAISAKTFGEADFDGGSTATSGLPVTYTSQTPAVVTIVGGKIHIVGAGTATLAINQAGNTQYLAAPQATVTFTVNKAAQTITAPSNVTLRPGETKSIAVTASSGLPVTLTLNSTAVVSLSGTSVTGNLEGSATIVASQPGNANYNAAGSVMIRVSVSPEEQLVSISGAVSPNGDGINDALIIQGITDYPVNTLTIFSRSGAQVYTANNYNNGSVAFTGIGSGGGILPAGTYTYVLAITHGGRRITQTGIVEIRR